MFIIFIALVWFLMIVFWDAGMSFVAVLAFTSRPAAILLTAALFGVPDRFKPARSERNSSRHRVANGRSSLSYLWLKNLCRTYNPACPAGTRMLHFRHLQNRSGHVMVATPDASPVGIFLNTDPCLVNLLTQVQKLAGDSGVSAYLVGGPVRDNLLDLPVKDLDISVVGDAPALAERLADSVSGRLTVHQRFGTATVVSQGATVDLVTARRETYRQPGALPDVQPGDIAEDLARRDFTVNAMALPLTGSDTRLVDPHGGRADLDAGIIRTLHPGSFRDDPTRMMRAVRYSSRLDFQLADTTVMELQHALAANALSTISADRIRHELDRISAEMAPLGAFRLAENLGVLTAIHPTLSVRYLSCAPDGQFGDPLVWLSALVWPLSPTEATSFAARVNAPADWMRTISDTNKLVSRLSQLEATGLSPSRVCAILDGLAPAALTAARALGPRLAADYIQRYLDDWWTVAPILRGTDLLELGVPPGPSVGEALRALRKARLDGITHTRQDEEDLARGWSTTSN